MSSRPCRFFVAGNCRNGDLCRFYHSGFSSRGASTLVGVSRAGDSGDNEETSISPGHRAERGARAAAASSSHASSSSRPVYAASRPCQWYMAGYCHRGESCWFSHDRGAINANYTGGEDTIVISDDDEDEDGTTRQAQGAAATNDNDEDEDQKCAICFEVPKTFGLLVSCNHAFCLTCIRTWRSKDIAADLQPYDSSNVSDSGDRHWCPFGDDCHFAHLDADGEPCKVNPDSNPRLNRQRRSQHGHYRHNPTIAQMRRGVFEAIRGASRSADSDYEGLRALLMELARLRTDVETERDAWTTQPQRAGGNRQDYRNSNYSYNRDDEFLDFDDGDDFDYEDDSNEYEYGYDVDDSDNEYYISYYEDG
ncbi:hypothetical protein BGZ99_004680 [Dissophora globulifera]|uniref:RING-type E3 ubiquitin transferase n=1 Tax=Dissophora globulifera TaxID=979702 RepID=A0A9P6RH40_9FUNG|nr:hypothetical protein BGZ99_004680 [Dissophora globulifera]